MPALASTRKSARHTARSDFADRAYAYIQDQMLRGALPFGSAISRREIAAKLGMSVLPVSEALQRLEQQNLVESIPRVGTCVRIPTPQDLRGFFIVREALEAQAARLFAENAGPRERRELVEAAGDLDALYEGCTAGEDDPGADELYRMRSLHMQFHRRIAECSGCPFLGEAIEKNHIMVFNWFYDQTFGTRGLPEGWHRQLAEALAGGDPEAADAALRKHVRVRQQELYSKLEPLLTFDRAKLLNLAKSGTRIPPRS
jgi:DNA-binding GntR family transcriptional regulator